MTPEGTSHSSEAKECAHCHERKPLGEYSKNRTKADGLSPQCKLCKRQQGKESYYRHLEARRQNNRDYTKKRRDEMLADPVTAQALREKQREATKRYHKDHPEKAAEWSKRWRDTHQEQVLAYEEARREARKAYFTERWHRLNGAGYE
jgi:hypothetical protein